MAFNTETRDLQRSLLKVLISNQMELRKYARSIKEVWFTCPERKFIFEKILSRFEKDKSFLTELLFQYSLKQEIEENNRANYEIEWNYICGKTVQESCEALIHSLNENEKASLLRGVLEETVMLVESGKIEEAFTVLKAKTINIDIEHDDCPIASVTDYKDLLAFMVDKRENPKKYVGVKTGFNFFDKKVGGLFAAELTLIAAVTGVGKSTIMKQIGANIFKERKNVLHVTNEENRKQVLLKYHSLLTGIPYNKLKNPEYLTPEELRFYSDFMEKMFYDKSLGKLHIKEIPQFTDITNIERAFIELEYKGERPDVVIIDYLDHMKPIQIAYNENDEQAKVAADAKGLSISCNVPVVAATQASTAAEVKQDKGKKFGKFDIYGSKRKVHAANTLIFVVQTGRDESQMPAREEFDCDWFWSVEIAKNRDGPQFSFDCRQHVATGKVEPMAGEIKQKEGQVLMGKLEGELKNAANKNKENKENEILVIPKEIELVNPLNIELEEGLLDPPTEEEESEDAKRARQAKERVMRYNSLK